MQRGVHGVMFLSFITAGRRGGRTARLPKASRELSQFNISSWWGPLGWERVSGEEQWDKSGGSIRTWWKNTVSARQKCRESRENVSGWEKKSKRRKKKKQDVLSGAVVEDTFMRHKDKEVKANGVQCLTFTAVKQLLSFHFSSPSVCTFR